MTTETDERPGPPPAPELVEYEIGPDDYSDSPRSWDNLGTLAYYEPGSRLNDFADCMIEQTWRDELWEDGYGAMIDRIKQDTGAMVVLPVVTTYNGVTTGDQWDTGAKDFDGVIYDTEETRMLLGVPADVMRINDWLVGEIKTLNQWVKGEVYQYMIVNDEGDYVGGCGGYYDLGECEMEAQSEALAINRKRFREWKKELDLWDQAPKTLTVSRSHLIGEKITVHDVVYEVFSFTGEKVNLQKVKQ